MHWFVIAVLVLVVIIFGVSSTAQSYATAQQAKAQIETAQVAQINAWGNLITILTLSLVIAVVLVILLVALYWFFARPRIGKPGRGSIHEIGDRPAPTLDAGAVNTLVQLEVLRTLRSMSGDGSPALLPPLKQEEEDLPAWLR